MPSQYVIIRNATYHFRYRIPNHLYWLFDKKELKFTLKTNNLTIASCLANNFIFKLKEVLTVTGLNTEFFRRDNIKAPKASLTLAEKTRIKAQFRAFVEEQIILCQERAHHSPDELASLIEELRNEELAYKIYTNALAINDYHANEIQYMAQEFMSFAPDRLAMYFSPPSPDYIEFAKEACKAQVELHQAKLRVSQGKPAVLPSSSNNSLVPNDGLSDITITELLPQYFQFQEKKQGKNNATLKKEYLTQINKFSEFTGNIKVSDITRQTMNDYCDYLSSLKNKKGQPLAPTTKNKYISKVKSLLLFAQQESLASLNFSLENLHFKEQSKDMHKREYFYSDEIEAFFNNDYYAMKKKFSYPSHYWAPLLILYAGMRPEELAQLYTNDIIQLSENSWVILVTDESLPDAEERYKCTYEVTSDKKIKTQNAKRQIPVHPKLIELGFINYVELLKEHKSILLFPNLTRNQKNGRAHNLIKWVSKHRKSFGWREKQTFYSFRHTTLHNLKNAGVPIEKALFIAGHEKHPSRTHIRYAKSYAAAPLVDAIHTLQFPVNIKPWNEYRYRYKVLTEVKKSNSEIQGKS